MTIPVAARSRCRSAASRLLGLRVRKPALSMDIGLLLLFCVVRYRAVLRADHSSRGVLPMCASTACDRKGQPRPGKVSKRHKKKTLHTRT